MPWVTEEEIQAAKNMTAYEYLRTHQAQRLQKTRTRNEWQLTDHDSFKINELSSKWHWKSRDIGGVSALRFLIEVDGMKFTDAVKLLCEERPSFLPTQSVEKEKPPFKLPERYCNCRRIRAYLNHRGISDEVIIMLFLSGKMNLKKRDMPSCGGSMKKMEKDSRWNRQEVKKSTVFVFLREKRRIGLLFTKLVLMHWHI